MSKQSHLIEPEVLPPITKDGVELAERESRIERAQRNAYYEIGLELKTIRDRKMYQAKREQPVAGKYSFTTFEEYCEQRWEMARQRAQQLIETAEAASQMSKICDVLPSRESHVRALLALDKDDDRANVWQRVIASGAEITAKSIQDEVERYKAEQDKNWITLEEWNKLDDAKQAAALEVKPDHHAQFNYQDDNQNIEWARWSWNPVTGCNHACPYCYARDIAERFYPQKFVPSIIPSRLSAPAVTKPKTPEADWTDVDKMGHRNVFTCSMADLFGKWVPDVWIEAVLQQVKDNPQWNFLFLSKFPEKMQNFKFPKNAWVGTTVDKQSTVDRAEKAFRKINASVKWLSCEPMMERLTFNEIGLFDWVVVGGSSKSTQTEAFLPPFEWIIHIYQQAQKAKTKFYMKTNLLGNRVREYPRNA